MARKVREITAGHKLKRTNELFELMDRGRTMQQAGEELDRRKMAGELSEKAFVAAVSTVPGVRRVVQSEPDDDFCRQIDYRVVMEDQFEPQKWKVQVKSNGAAVESMLNKKRPQFRVRTTGEVRKVMAKNGSMVIDAGLHREDPEANAKSIVEQFEGWLRLSVEVRQKH